MRGLVLAALALVVGCRDEGPPRAEVAVFAASSLTESFQAIEAAFEAAHPGVDVRLTFAGSQVLRLQIEQGAGADVFASADARHMSALGDAGHVAESHVFARNGLVVITPLEGSPVRTFADLPRAERLVIGAEAVPVGRYTRRMLAQAGATLGADFAGRVRARVASEETNVRIVRAKVELGEADAAIVYRTDASPRVRVVPVPEAIDAPAAYHIAALAGADDAARAFVAFVRAPEGRAILAARGFGSP